MKTHWKKAFNPNYLGAYAMDGTDKVLTIARVASEKVRNTDGKEEEVLVLHWKEKEKPMILNKTNSKAVAKVAKSNYIEDWVNVRISIYTSNVRAFGESVDALRIRDFAPKGKESLDDTRFAKMLESIKAGKFAKSDAIGKFLLTDTQKKLIDDLV